MPSKENKVSSTIAEAVLLLPLSYSLVDTANQTMILIIGLVIVHNKGVTKSQYQFSNKT